eukprot:CAMPEP_0119359744 /NCGR_PEP_ID=MMETSP1334-20130426/7554_1 /TAXON_ID=127549 /ORGANISM="Calcidiscus leptoporus, Strain RCC1130" /LENGTH=193 /DNA_ID=CAMNT_0007374463 /DNA_START=355 /DNA_END=934 /DNA_ORIENTATION=+
MPCHAGNCRVSARRAPEGRERLAQPQRMPLAHVVVGLLVCDAEHESLTGYPPQRFELDMVDGLGSTHAAPSSSSLSASKEGARTATGTSMAAFLALHRLQLRKQPEGVHVGQLEVAEEELRLLHRGPRIVEGGGAGGSERQLVPHIPQQRRQLLRRREPPRVRIDDMRRVPQQRRPRDVLKLRICDRDVTGRD